MHDNSLGEKIFTQNYNFYLTHDVSRFTFHLFSITLYARSHFVAYIYHLLLETEK